MTTTDLTTRSKRYVQERFPSLDPAAALPLVKAADSRLLSTSADSSSSGEVSRSLPLLCPLLVESGLSTVACSRTQKACPSVDLMFWSFDYELCDSYVAESVCRAKRRIAQKVEKRFNRLVHEARLEGSRLVLSFDEEKGSLDLVSDLQGRIRSFHVGMDPDVLVSQVSECLMTLDPVNLSDPLAKAFFVDVDRFLSEGEVRVPEVRFVSSTSRFVCLQVDQVSFLYETASDPYALCSRFYEKFPSDSQGAFRELFRALSPVEDALERTVALTETSRNNKHGDHFVSSRAAASYLTKLALRVEGEIEVGVSFDLDRGEFITTLREVNSDKRHVIRGLSLTRAHEGSRYLFEALSSLGFDQGTFAAVFGMPESRSGTVWFRRGEDPCWEVNRDRA